MPSEFQSVSGFDLKGYRPLTLGIQESTYDMIVVGRTDQAAQLGEYEHLGFNIGPRGNFRQRALARDQTSSSFRNLRVQRCAPSATRSTGADFRRHDLCRETEQGRSWVMGYTRKWRLNPMQANLIRACDGAQRKRCDER